MSLIHLTSQHYRTASWSGGTTTQLCIFPPEADYARRTFLWRISSAAVELEESDFTPLPDYERWIAPVQGSMTLTHNGGAPIALAPYCAHAFDGADATHSQGRCTDFNLMLRKGAAHGRIFPLTLGPGEKRQLTLAPGEKPRAALLLFCGEGTLTLTHGGETATLAPFESALLDAPGELTLSAPAAARLLAAEVFY